MQVQLIFIYNFKNIRTQSQHCECWLVSLCPCPCPSLPSAPLTLTSPLHHPRSRMLWLLAGSASRDRSRRPESRSGGGGVWLTMSPSSPLHCTVELPVPVVCWPQSCRAQSFQRSQGPYDTIHAHCPIILRSGASLCWDHPLVMWPSLLGAHLWGCGPSSCLPCLCCWGLVRDRTSHMNVLLLGSKGRLSSPVQLQGITVDLRCPCVCGHQ